MFTSLNHIGFEVPDIDEAKQFFVEVLGFRVLHSEEIRSNGLAPIWFELLKSGYGSGECAFLEHASNLRIGLAKRGDINQTAETFDHNSGYAQYHLALNVTSLKAVMDSLSEYPDLTILNISHHRDWESVYFTTPWGMYIQLIEIQTPTAQRI
jgi:catechol 2,3-dioxygenase-like lactoylglutathione lyase family enzyme